jgi:AhpD family alkylhydroperoxidase
MARISLDPPRTLLNRIAAWYSRRTYGTLLDPGAALGHHPGVLLTCSGYELALARWNRLDPTLKSLAVLATATRTNCSWCVDFGFWESSQRGIDPALLRDVPRWRDSDRFTDVQRDVLGYAEAMTATPPEVDDAMVARLRENLDDAALVELTMMIAVENSRSRVNSALGLTSQGFRESCGIPAP